MASGPNAVNGPGGAVALPSPPLPGLRLDPPDELVLASEAALAVLGEPAGKFFLQATVGLRLLRMHPQVVPEAEVALDLGIPALEYGDMVRPERLLPLDEEPSAGNPALSLGQMAEGDHRRVESIHFSDVTRFSRQIEDGLGRDSGDRRAADVANRNRLAAEDLAQPTSSASALP